MNTIGIDIGGTSTKYGLVSESGTIIEQGSIPTCVTEDPQDFVERLKTALNPLMKNVSAIGIGAPNGNYYSGNIEHAPNLKWKGIVPMAELVEQSLKLKTRLTNDANAAAMGEMIFGNAKSMKNFIMITLGTGLGSGIVVDGKVVYGHSGFAGEMGQVIVIPGGRQCGCGRLGCLETYASATGIVRTVKLALETPESKSSLRGQELSAALITKAALEGDELALNAFEFTGEILGRALANAVTFTSPECIFLFGGLAKAGPLIFEPTQKHFSNNLHNIFQNTVKILPSALPESDAAILGAAALIKEPS